MPSARAMASVTAESMPPESSTTARFCMIFLSGKRSDAGLVTGHVAPQQLVQLHLQAYRQPVREYPLGQLSRRELPRDRREQHLALRRDRVLAKNAYRPVVVGAIGQHELHLVMR